MANVTPPQAACYEIESSWAEAASTATTYRIPLTAPVALNLTHGSEPAGRVTQYRSGGIPHVKMTKGGTFETEFDWRGHGSTMVGSPSLDALETLMGIVIGEKALSLATSQTCTGGTAAIPTMSGATGVSAGGLVRVGALGDGDGDGQFYAVTSHAGSNLTLVGAMNGAPVNGAVVYPVTQVYPLVSTHTIQSTRWLIQSKGVQYLCRGVFPMAFTKTGLDPAQRPKIRVTWGVSDWDEVDVTFPSAVASDEYLPNPIANGSLNIQVVGTTTRNVRTSARSLSITHTLSVTPLMGYGGVNAAQVITGAVRGDDTIELEYTEDADDSTTTPVVPGYWEATGSYHIEFTGSVVDGKAIGFKAPKACPMGDKPVMFTDGNVNRFRLRFALYALDTASTDLARAPIVYGWA